MFRLSDIPEYLEYGRALAEDDHSAARHNLKKCIALARDVQEPETVALLYQFLGNVEYRAGDPSEALTCYEAAEREAPEPPLIRIEFAKFLAKRFRDPKAALEKCAELEVFLTSSWCPTPDDLSREEYLRRIAEVREAAGA